MSTNVYDFTTKNEKALFAISNYCYWCENSIIIEMTYRQHKAYIEKTALVQDIFPHISKEEREMLITGTHPKCWDEMLLENYTEEEEV